MAPPMTITPEGFDQPSQRFKILGNQIGQLDNEVGSQVGAAKGAAGDGGVSGALDVFAQGVSGALMVLDSDACLLGGNIAQAKITYQVTDANAYVVSDLTPTS